MTKRVDLGDGDWGELSERPTHGQYNAIYKAYVASAGDPALSMDLLAVAVSTLITTSSIRGEDGQQVDPKTSVDAVPMDKLMALGAEGMAIFASVKLPKVSTPKSSEPSSAEPSTAETSPTPSSATP
jgi:hypothetical protein